MKIHEKRISIAKQAVLNVRRKTEYSIRLYKRSMIATSPNEWAIGIIGILNFVQTGDVDKILLHEVRDEVRKLLSEAN